MRMHAMQHAGDNAEKEGYASFRERFAWDCIKLAKYVGNDEGGLGIYEVVPPFRDAQRALGRTENWCKPIAERAKSEPRLTPFLPTDRWVKCDPGDWTSWLNNSKAY